MLGQKSSIVRIVDGINVDQPCRVLYSVDHGSSEEKKPALIPQRLQGQQLVFHFYRDILRPINVFPSSLQRSDST